MKEILRYGILIHNPRLWLMVAGIFILLHIPGGTYAQTDSLVTDTTQAEAVVAAEESSLISPTLEFATVQKADNSIDLKVSLRAKVNGSFYILPKVKLSFLQVTETGDRELGFVITDRTGKGTLNLKAGAVAAGADGKYSFKVSYAGSKQMEAAEEELTIKKARLEMVPVKEDSLLTVTVRLIDLSTGTEVPVPETAVGIFVGRMFNPLKIGEGTTDETGEAVIEVQNGLPGDSKGNLTLFAKLDESEDFGKLEASVVQPWGKAISNKIEDQPRALWSSNPPIWMLVTFIVLMSIVWGHYIVIVVQLFRLRKEEPHPVV